MSVRRRVTRAQLRRGLRVRVAQAPRSRVQLRLARQAGNRTLVRLSRTQASETRSYRLKPRARPRVGRLRLSVTVTSATGEKSRLRATIRVKR